jgi:hypothetical protein
MTSQESTPSEQKTCFVIAPIGKDDSETRKRSDMLLEHIFVPALEPLGYEVIRADKISEPGSITIQVLERILQADIVIADLTDHNPNVFYELAVRHALKKGVIHVICSGQTIPFDIADLRTIHIVLDIPGAARAIEEIAAQAKQLEVGEMGQTPVGLANILNRSETTRDENGILLREMLDRISELGSAIREMNHSQQSSSHHLQREMKMLFRRSTAIHHEEVSHRDRDQDAFKISVSAKELEETLQNLDTEAARDFKKLSPRDKEVAAAIFAELISKRPDATFNESLERAMDFVQEFESPSHAEGVRRSKRSGSDGGR